MSSTRKSIAVVAVFATLTIAYQYALAGSESTPSCPEPTEHVRDALENLVERLARSEGRGLTVPMSAIHSAQRSDVRELASEGDEEVCRALYQDGHSEYLEKTWNQEFNIGGDIYPYYDAGYYKVGDYYFVLFVKTPTPQDKDLSETRMVTGYSTALIYNEEIQKIAGYSF